ncbi:hypoxia inducible factor 1 subunit alpha, like isoform X2 [Boleophthalmus pectinirostris]|uniref:hypoxia inducible factor 1 subunit alpha, like isoform X2 n=1 Tax=Boleophthalmus pectinirostris TaxID=150288 RepID=UPI0024310298|nr:hypoxia inducible factor 1 subunit alpha, like isoform X2 [Boleophthalmus pectinirostris]
METPGAPVVAKRSNSEQRKLRSRDAARCRRSQETEVFYELAHVLPLPRRVSTHLDKAAIMRVTLSYLRLRHLLTTEAENSLEDPMDQFYSQVLGGFIMVLSEEGDIIYLSESVSAHIGITQLELLGQNLYEFVHPCDQEELRDMLTTRTGVSRKQAATDRSFFLRVKNTLTNRGRTVNLRSATWKVLHCIGHMRSQGGNRILSLLCEPLPHPSSVEFPLDSSTLLTRHSMDLHFTHCEGRVLELLGYEPYQLIGCSAYHFYHALDFDHINSSLQILLSKGQVRTKQYRFLANNGGFVWIETQATVLYSRSGQPEAIVCLNFILSAIEQAHVLLSVEQRQCEDLKKEPQSPTPQENAHTNTESPAEPCSPGPALCPGNMVPTPQTLCSLWGPFGLQAGSEGCSCFCPTGLTKLSFSSPKPNSEPTAPQDLCSPALRQLLSPIFNMSPSSPVSSSQAPSPKPEVALSQEQPMDTSGVERFFAMWPDAQKDQGHTLLMDDMDLDMLAPYISMDDDFQLCGLSVPEETEAPGPSALGSRSRKRVFSVDAEECPDKRHKGPLSMEEKQLQSHGLLGCLEENNQSGRGWNQLLTDKDPVLGGVQSEHTALMAELFLSSPPDLSPPLSPMT